MNLGAFLAGHAPQFIIMALLLCASGFFSGTETALFSLSRGQLQRLAKGGATGRVVLLLQHSPRQLLNTLLLGNMLVNVAYASIAAVQVLLFKKAGGSSLTAAAASLGGLLVLILLGEVTPKILALNTQVQWIHVAARPLLFVRRVVALPLWVVDRLIVSPLTRIIAPQSAGGVDITAEELSALMDLSAKRGLIDRDANALLQEIMELTDLRVSDIMVPRVDMIAYNVADSPQGLIDLFRQSNLRKIPVYEGDIDYVLGMVHAKRLLLDPGRSLGELVVKVPFVPEAASVERLLLQFRVTRTQMAIVVDEYGGTAGLVTLEDALEEIVGDIPAPDEAEQGPAVRKIADNEYLLDGDLAIHEWQDAFGTDLSQKRISTLGGFVTLLLGRVPREGDVATYRNLRFEVLSMRRRRVAAIKLQLRQEET